MSRAVSRLDHDQSLGLFVNTVLWFSAVICLGSNGSQPEAVSKFRGGWNLDARVAGFGHSSGSCERQVADSENRDGIALAIPPLKHVGYGVCGRSVKPSDSDNGHMKRAAASTAPPVCAAK